MLALIGSHQRADVKPMTVDARPRLSLESCHQCGLPSLTFRDLREHTDDHTGTPECAAVTIDFTDDDQKLDEFPAAQSF